MIYTVRKLVFMIYTVRWTYLYDLYSKKDLP